LFTRKSNCCVIFNRSLSRVTDTARQYARGRGIRGLQQVTLLVEVEALRGAALIEAPQRK
jgi:hypothetical protein